MTVTNTAMTLLAVTRCGCGKLNHLLFSINIFPTNVPNLEQLSDDLTDKPTDSFPKLPAM
jgi:hypothetical protein